ncbi:unnamed protein product [Kuraishia capsulata CBS 1993]|uniref:Uncharacterized protein n=1 Tax=Kuraishia capsulata CBS 1993 TaxID=1382522 RepID=W6MJJ5_9ASCO|nr:uncharacterized protein KUCA_T00000583001 [Kuraishia capsulata CBS 1993]CDK24617.1 unnamed protein product [Kuraishia capsulata CBS 1993]
MAYRPNRGILQSSPTKVSRAGTGFEFTPVGGRRSTAHSSDPARERGSPKGKLFGSPLKRPTLPDLSFLNSGDEVSSYASSPVAKFTGADIFSDDTPRNKFETVYNAETAGVNEVQTERNELSRENIALKIEIETLRQMLKPGASMRTAELVQKLKIQNMDLFHENERLLGQLNQNQENSFGSPTKTNETSELLMSLRSENEETKATMRKIALQRDEALQETTRLQELLHQLQSDELRQADLSQENSQLKNQLAEKDDRIYDLERKVRQLENDRDELQTDFDELNYKLSDNSGEMGKNDDKIADLEAELKEITHRLRSREESGMESNVELHKTLDDTQRRLEETEMLFRHEKEASRELGYVNEKLKKEIDELREEIDDLELDRQDLNDLCLKLKKDQQGSLGYAGPTENQQYERDFSVFRRQNEKLRDELLATQDKLKASSASTEDHERVASIISDLESENRKLKEQVMLSKNSDSKLHSEREYIELLEENQIQRKEISQLKTDFEQATSHLQQRLDTAQTKLFDLQYAAARSESTVKELETAARKTVEKEKSQMEDLIKQKASADVRLKNASQEIESLQRNVDLLRKQLSQQSPSSFDNTKLDQALSDLDAARKSNRELTKDLFDSNDKLRDLERKYSQANEQRNKLDDLVASLERDVQRLKEDGPSLDRKLRSLSLEARGSPTETRLRDMVDDKSEELNNLRREYDNMRHDLVKKVEQVVEQREGLKMENDDLIRRLKSSENDIYELSAKMSDLRREAEKRSQLQSENSKLKHELEAINSRASSIPDQSKPALLLATHQLLLSKYSSTKSKMLDLQVANSCLGSIVSDKNEEIALLESRGIYTEPPKKVTWRSVAMVLWASSVMMKTIKENNNRKAKEESLKKEIRSLR